MVLFLSLMRFILMKKTLFSIWSLIVLVCGSYSQREPPESFLASMDSLFEYGYRQKMFPGISCAYVDADTTWLKSYGVRAWDTEEKINSNTIFQLGSIGKILTAIAVLQQHDIGNLDIDEDINTYLAYPLETYNSSTITIRHLLTHSAGMNDKNIGYLAADSSQLQALEDHLIDELPSFYQPPGLEINYSNYSYALAGLIVEYVSGTSFNEYVQKRIFDPLQMKNSYMGFDFAYENSGKHAIGHTKTDEVFTSNKEYARSALPAGSFSSNAVDMSRLLDAINRKDSSILGDGSWDLLFERSFSNHTLLPGYSLGLEEQHQGERTFWAKGGMLLGFLSQVIFLSDSSALFISQNTAADDFLEFFHKELQSSLLSKTQKEELEPMPVNVADYVGEYRNARYDREGVENIILLFRGAFTVLDGGEGLTVWHNGRYHSYVFQGDHVFVNEEDPNEKMVFVADENGMVSKLYRNINIGGIYVPATYEKTSWYNSPTFVNDYYGIALLIIVGYGIISTFMLGVSLIKLWKPGFWKWPKMPIVNHLVALLGITAMIVHIAKSLLLLIKQPTDFLFGLPPEFVFFNKVGYILPICSIALWVLLVGVILKKKGIPISRFLYAVFTLAFSAHVLFLYYWNFI